MIVTAIVIRLEAVLVAAIVAMVVGAFWYSPLGFGEAWMRLTGMKKPTKSMKKKVQKAYALMFVSSLVMSLILAFEVRYNLAVTLLDGAMVGVWLWLGFVATTQLTGVLWQNKSWTLYFIESGYYLVVLAITGALLTVWV